VRGMPGGDLTLVALSCKGRGGCPSCTTRRAIEAGAHAHAEASLPIVSHRQWTLSVPRALRLVVVREPSLFKLVERTLVRAAGRASAEPSTPGRWRWRSTSAAGCKHRERSEGGGEGPSPHPQGVLAHQAPAPGYFPRQRVSQASLGVPRRVRVPLQPSELGEPVAPLRASCHCGPEAPAAVDGSTHTTPGGHLNEPDIPTCTEAADRAVLASSA